MANQFDGSVTMTAHCSTGDRKTDKQQIEKFRRDRMNVSIEELKGFLVKFNPNQATKLEKADILEQTVTLVSRLITDKERFYSDGYNRGMTDVCTVMRQSGNTEAQKAAHYIMLSLRSPPAIQMPPSSVPLRPAMPQQPPSSSSFGFMGFPRMPMLPTQMMPPTAMNFSAFTPPQATKTTVKQNETATTSGSTSVSDEEVDIENVDNQNDDTFIEKTPALFSRSLKRKNSSSDDSGIVDTTPKRLRQVAPAGCAFSIDRLLVPQNTQQA